MRRKDREITDLTKVISIIDACDCCRLGFVDKDEAYIVPMNFGYEFINDTLILYFHCAPEGRKMKLIPKQKSVTFEMDTNHALVSSEYACSTSFLYQCVMGTGTLEIMEDEKKSGLNQIMKHYTGKEDWNYNQKGMDNLCVLKLTVSKWSCKAHQI